MASTSSVVQSLFFKILLIKSCSKDSFKIFIELGSQAIWSQQKVTGYKVIYGTERVYSHCGCRAKPDTDKWEKIIDDIERNTRWTEEMILVVTTTSGYKYIYKCTTDMRYIIYYQYKKCCGWKEKRRISIENDFERYLGISVIQWIQKSFNLYGIVQGSTVIACGRVEEFPYVLNRLWLNYLVALSNELFILKKFQQRKKIFFLLISYQAWPQY